MSWILERLTIDPAAVAAQIERLLRNTLQQTERSGALLGLSGGLDSAVVAYLAARALGPDKVTALNLPDRDSKALHQQHAQHIADQLGIHLQTRDITPMLEALGVYDLLPIGSLPGQRLKQLAVALAKSLTGLGRAEDMLAARLRPQANSLLAKANAYAMAKHRLRMLLLYQHAEIEGAMVVGAANRTEWLTGTFALWGCDHCADVMPIIHLYRSQLPSLAAYLGVPQSVVSKPADPDMWPGAVDKEPLGSFAVTDQILWGLENGVERGQLVGAFGQDAVRRIERLYELSRPMREVPYGFTPAARCSAARCDGRWITARTC
jgi:NAD+ synthase